MPDFSKFTDEELEKYIRENADMQAGRMSPEDRSKTEPFRKGEPAGDFMAQVLFPAALGALTGGIGATSIGGLLAGSGAGAGINAVSAMMAPPETPGDYASFAIPGAVGGALSHLTRPILKNAPRGVPALIAGAGGLLNYEVSEGTRNALDGKGFSMPNPISGAGATSAMLPMAFDTMIPGLLRSSQAAGRMKVMEKLGLSKANPKLSTSDQFTRETQEAISGHLNALETQIKDNEARVLAHDDAIKLAKQRYAGDESKATESYRNQLKTWEKEGEDLAKEKLRLQQEREKFRGLRGKASDQLTQQRQMSADLLREARDASATKVDALDMQIGLAEKSIAEAKKKIAKLGGEGKFGLSPDAPGSGLVTELRNLETEYDNLLLDRLDMRQRTREEVRAKARDLREQRKPLQEGLQTAKADEAGAMQQKQAFEQKELAFKQQQPENPLDSLREQHKQDLSMLGEDNLHMHSLQRRLETDFSAFKEKHPELAKLANLSDEEFIDAFFKPSTTDGDIGKIMKFLHGRTGGEETAKDFQRGMVNEIAKRYVMGHKVTLPQGQQPPMFGPEKLQALLGATPETAQLVDKVLDAFGNLAGARGAVANLGSAVGKQAIRVLPWMIVFHANTTLNPEVGIPATAALLALGYPQLIERVMKNPETGKQLLNWARGGATFSGLKAYPLIAPLFKSGTDLKPELEALAGEDDRRNRMAKAQMYGTMPTMVPQSGEVPLPVMGAPQERPGIRVQ